MRSAAGLNEGMMPRSSMTIMPSVIVSGMAYRRASRVRTCASTLLVYLHAPARAQPADLPAGMNDPVIHAVDPAGAANARDGVGPSKSVVRIQQSFERGEIGRMRAPNPEHDRLRV
ncbi:hypothetical protein ABC766_09280 [Methylobacterium fujisawaense]|uniref:hypothetical protein n=1 Tax=Methylobacterium fujisawaense TaxID=107400 RepID=UPI0031F52350